MLRESHVKLVSKVRLDYTRISISNSSMDRSENIPHNPVQVTQHKREVSNSFPSSGKGSGSTSRLTKGWTVPVHALRKIPADR